MRAFLAVDVQNDFCPGGALATAQGANAAIKIGELLNGAHGYDFLVATQDWHIDPGDHFSTTPDYIDSWPVHCVAESPGARLHSALHGVRWDAVVRKGEYTAAYNGFEGFTNSGVPLGDWFRDNKVTDLDIAGIATDYCVRATVLEALHQRFKVRLLTDYIAAVSPESGERALEEMERAGALLLQSPHDGV